MDRTNNVIWSAKPYGLAFPRQHFFLTPLSSLCLQYYILGTNSEIVIFFCEAFW